LQFITISLLIKEAAMEYETWLAEVNKIVEKACGLPMDVLPDWLSRDAYDEGLSPEEGAEICLEESGFYDSEDDETDDSFALASAGFGTDEDYGLFDEL
jgi:hypothetical protein